jgi:2-desacetyl-2-hydroxyethyl bacteriochlorophyllide A dehydrogenase
MKTRSIVFTGVEKVEVVEEDVPALGAEQVLVRTTVSLISTGTEMFCFKAVFDPDTGWAKWVQYPFHTGYSTSTEVIGVGSKVTNLRKGDRVFTCGPHTEYQVIPPSAAIPVPEGVSDEAASWSALAGVTQTAVRRAEHALGDTAVVVGLGPLGQLVTQYLRVLGLKEILAIDTVRGRLDLAARFGATATFQGSAADAREFVRQHTEGKLADVVYDVTGHWSVLPLALPLARQFGKLILLGDSPEPSKQHLTPDVLNRQVNIVGSHSAKLPPQHAHWTYDRQIQLFFTYIRRGLFHIDELNTHRYRPDEAATVYPRLLRDRTETMGVLFDWRLL